jgi:hypothetical protein
MPLAGHLAAGQAFSECLRGRLGVDYDVRWLGSDRDGDAGHQRNARCTQTQRKSRDLTVFQKDSAKACPMLLGEVYRYAQPLLASCSRVEKHEDISPAHAPPP